MGKPIRLKAYVADYQGLIAYYADVSAGKARYQAYLQIKDMLNPKVTFAQITVWRANKLDALAARVLAESGKASFIPTPWVDAFEEAHNENNN